jgi:hypothetical protein
MFKRYTWPAKRSIFFAWMVGFSSDRKPITSMDLLAGMLWDDNTRADVLFHLRELFPLYHGRPWKYAELPPRTRVPELDREVKQIIAWTGAEATRLGDYWIDTEHLLLGILRVSRCDAARYLKCAGLSLKAARKKIRENCSSRPDYGPLPRFWPIQSKVKTIVSWGWP